MEAKHRLGMAAANFAGNLFIFDNNDVTFSMAFVDLTQAIYPAFLFFGMAKNHTLLVTNLIQMDCLASCFFSGSWCRRSRTPTTIRNSKLNVFFQLYKKKCTKMCTKNNNKILNNWLMDAGGGSRRCVLMRILLHTRSKTQVKNRKCENNKKIN